VQSAAAIGQSSDPSHDAARRQTVPNRFASARRTPWITPITAGHRRVACALLGRVSRPRQSPPLTSGVRHVLTILAVERFRESVDFYEAAFGWPAVVTTPVYVEFALTGGQRLGIYERESFGRNTGRVPSTIPDAELAPTELYFYADDLRPAIERLKRAGARELSALAHRPWGDEAAYFADPSGNVLVMARPLDGTP
jgi:predicted enzyme related to lactoylglutathione lyase